MDEKVFVELLSGAVISASALFVAFLMLYIAYRVVKSRKKVPVARVPREFVVQEEDTLAILSMLDKYNGAPSEVVKYNMWDFIARLFPEVSGDSHWYIDINANKVTIKEDI